MNVAKITVLISEWSGSLCRYWGRTIVADCRFEGTLLAGTKQAKFKVCKSRQKKLCICGSNNHSQIFVRSFHLNLHASLFRSHIYTSILHTPHTFLRGAHSTQVEIYEDLYFVAMMEKVLIFQILYYIIWGVHTSRYKARW